MANRAKQVVRRIPIRRRVARRVRKTYLNVRTRTRRVARRARQGFSNVFSIITNIVNRRVVQNPLALPLLLFAMFLAYAETNTPQNSWFNDIINNADFKIPSGLRDWLSNNYVRVVGMVMFLPALSAIPSKRFPMAFIMSVVWVFFSPVSTPWVYFAQSSALFLFFVSANKYVRIVAIIGAFFLIFAVPTTRTDTSGVCSQGHCSVVTGYTDRNEKFCYEGLTKDGILSDVYYQCNSNLHTSQCCCEGKPAKSYKITDKSYIGTKPCKAGVVVSE